MKLHMAVVGSPSLIVLIVAVDVRHSFFFKCVLLVFCVLVLDERVEMAVLRSYVKVELAVLGFPSLWSLWTYSNI